MLNESEELVKKLLEKKYEITTAESCTGGLVAGAITDVPGASEVFRRGYITYCDQAKEEMIGVSKETIERYGVVSGRCAVAMAEGAAKTAHCDCAISVTGIAGPGGGSKEQPVGLVYIGYYCNGVKMSERHIFSGSREDVRKQAVASAIHGMLLIL